MKEKDYEKCNCGEDGCFISHEPLPGIIRINNAYNEQFCNDCWRKVCEKEHDYLNNRYSNI